MSENRFKYLFESNRLGSMRAASDYLNLAPSSISRQISLLEDELGLELIERGTRKVQLTAAGELAIQHYVNQRTQTESFYSELDDLRGIRTGNVELAIGEGFVGTVLSDVINNFLLEYPGVTLRIHVGSTTDNVSRIGKDEAHIGLVFEPPIEPLIHLRTTVLQPINLVVQPNHPLAKMPAVTIEDVSKIPLAMTQTGFRIRDIFDTVLHKQQLYYEPHLISDSLLVLKNFAMSGAGGTILPPLAVTTEEQAGGLVCVPISSYEFVSTKAGIITRRGRRLPVAAAKLLQFLRTQIASWH